MTWGVLLAVLAAVSDGAAALVVLVPICRETSDDRARLAGVLASAETPLRFGHVTTGHVARAVGKQPEELRKVRTDDWTARLVRDRNRSLCSAGLALLGAFLTAASIASALSLW